MTALKRFGLLVHIEEGGWTYSSSQLFRRAEIHKVVYAIKVIESLNYPIFRMDKALSLFPSDYALLKGLYFATDRVAKNGRG